MYVYVFISVMLDIWLKLFAAANHKNKILQKTLWLKVMSTIIKTWPGAGNFPPTKTKNYVVNYELFLNIGVS